MLPFDASKLESLMEADDLDAILVNTRHNIRYLTGGYYYHFHARQTRMARTQYLPLLGLPRADVQSAFYVGTSGEEGDMTMRGLWVDERIRAARGTTGAAEAAAAALKARGIDRGRIGLEMPFLPADAYLTLQRALPQADLTDATPALDELRAIKTADEVALVRRASEITAAAILDGFHAGRPGITTAELADTVRLSMERQGLAFLWCFTNVGPDFLRTPGPTPWLSGRALHLDAGGEIGDYLADLCRMACLGEPSPLVRDLHAACLAVQEAVRPYLRPGVPSCEVHQAGQQAVAASPFAQYARFTAHGVGMVSHEQPIINAEITRPLAAGMVLSVETDILHPDAGHIKIEDSIVITDDGFEALGDAGRDLQVIG